VEDGPVAPANNGLRAVGVSRGVVVAMATGDGDLVDRPSRSDGEAKRIVAAKAGLNRAILDKG
jgi:putative transposase